MQIKRSAVALLLVLVAVLNCARAEDDAAAGGLEQLPPGVVLTGDKEPVPMKEFLGGGGGGFIPGGIPGGGIRYRYKYSFPGGFGWAYPLPFWNSIGRSIFGGRCGFGRIGGGLFFC